MVKFGKYFSVLFTITTLVGFSGFLSQASAITPLQGPTVLSSWTAPTTDTAYPQLSADGAYVAYGKNVTDLTTKETHSFANDPCKSSLYWLTQDTLTCTDFTNRYEISTSDWTAIQTEDDPKLVAGNTFYAKDGHWVSATPGRVVEDGNVFDGAGYSAISGDAIAYADPNNTLITLSDPGALEQNRTFQVGKVFGLELNNGYIVYAGANGTHGIDPSGKDYNLTASPGAEGAGNIGSIFFIGNTPWISTQTTISGQGSGIIVRPWGSNKVIVFAIPATQWSAVYNVVDGKGVITVAGSQFGSGSGTMTVQTISADTPLVDICGTKCTATAFSPTVTNQPPAPLPTKVVTPPIPNQGLPSDLGSLIESIFNWALNIIGLVIFVRFFYAGFKWFTARGNSSTTGEALEIMKNAAIGAVILFAAYLILYTINPDLVKSTINLPGIPGGVTSSQTNGTTGTKTGTTTTATSCFSPASIDYGGDVSNAEDALFTNDPDLADLPVNPANITTYIDGLIVELTDRGFRAGRVLSCDKSSTIPNQVMIAGRGDTVGVVCTVAASSGTTISDSALATCETQAPLTQFK